MADAICWPIHPQPLRGESLTSWLMRVANANVSSVQSFLSSYLGEAEWRRRDLDLLDKKELSLLASLGRVQGGVETLWSMVLTPWNGVMAHDNEADHKAWVNSLRTTRYCPICLSKDAFPYLRLKWRLHVLPICVDHKVVLQNRCWNRDCGYSQPIARFRSDEGLGVCSRCGSPLSHGPAIPPKNCEHLIRFTAAIVDILDKGKLPKYLAWPYKVNEFFAVLRLLVRFFNLYQPKESSWEELLQTHGLPRNPPFDWRKNDAVACILLENSLKLIQNWPTNMMDFVRANQARFNRLCGQYGAPFPKVLKIFRMTRRENGNPTGGYKSRSEMADAVSLDEVGKPSRTISCEERVRHVVKYLVECNVLPSERKVSNITGVGRKRLQGKEILRNIIREGKARLKLKELSDVKNAIEVLHARGLRVTTASVATYLGRSYRYVRKWRRDF